MTIDRIESGKPVKAEETDASEALLGDVQMGGMKTAGAGGSGGGDGGGGSFAIIVPVNDLIGKIKGEPKEEERKSSGGGGCLDRKYLQKKVSM